MSAQLFSESLEENTIHANPLNFEECFKDESQYFENIERLYQGIPFEPDPTKQTVMLAIGPSGAGKDAVMDEALKQGLSLVHSVTATTRNRRYVINEPHEFESEYINKMLGSILSPTVFDLLFNMWNHMGKISPIEAADKYIWMRGRYPSETEENYINNLRAEYDLIEYDAHHGNVYGLPKKSIIAALAKPGNIPLIRTETKGAITLSQTLKNDFNILTIGILPDNMQQLEEAARQREHPEKRLAENLEIIEGFPQVANFYLHNSRKPKILDGQEVPGLQISVNALTKLLQKL
jgi:guanylate kinase